MEMRLHPDDISLIVTRVAQAINKKPEDIWIKNAKDACKILGCSLPTLQNLRNEATPRIIFKYMSPRVIWYLESSLINFKSLK